MLFRSHTLRSVDDWNHGFRLHSLRCLIDQNRIENEITEKTVTRCIASRHDNTGLTDNLMFYCYYDLEVLRPLFIANPFSFLHVHKERNGCHATSSDTHDFLSANAVFFFQFLSGQDMNAQIFHRRRLVLFAECHHTHHVDSRLVNTLTNLICSNVGWSAHENAAG